MTRTRNLSIREANLRTIRDIEARIPAARTSAIDECIEVVKQIEALRHEHGWEKAVQIIVSRLTALKGEG